jgi:hypothetical protein
LKSPIDANLHKNFDSASLATSTAEQPVAATSTSAESSSSTASTAAPAKEFVFGEKLTDRVINTTAESEGTNSDLSGKETGATDSASGVIKSSASGSLWTSSTDADERADTLENDANTIIKLNCKLFVLESNKGNC